MDRTCGRTGRVRTFAKDPLSLSVLGQIIAKLQKDFLFSNNLSVWLWIIGLLFFDDSVLDRNVVVLRLEGCSNASFLESP